MNNHQIATLLMEGLEDKDKWGFGLRRICVNAANLENFPYTFTALGYKDQNGKLYLAMRANVDQCSPVEMREWDRGIDIQSTWSELMVKLISKINRTANVINNYKF